MQNKKILSTLVTRSLRHPWLRAGGGKTKFLSEFVCVASAYNTGLTVQERNNINDGIVSLLHPNFASRPGGVGSVILGRASLVPKTPSPSWSARRPPKPPGVRQNFVRPNVICNLCLGKRQNPRAKRKTKCDQMMENLIIQHIKNDIHQFILKELISGVIFQRKLMG